MTAFNTALNQRPAATAPLTVSQLTHKIRGIIEPEFYDVAVIGEVSNFKQQSSGHWYFSLKDRFATLPCAFFRKQNQAVKFDLQDGLKVVARGRLEIYPPKGGYQLIINTLEPVGVGSWQLAFDQLKDRLEREGLLDPKRKRAIPLMPRKIGIVTSPTAAALRDIVTAMRRRNHGVQIVISPTRVQGEGAEHEITQAIKDIQKIPGIEVIIVARGGGSIEDLWCFNTEMVARAVSASLLPVISGIGHETDVTICDLVADLRAPTPTAAAELVSQGHAELSQRWSSLRRLLLVKMEHRLMQAHRRLERLNPRHALARQHERLKQMRLKLETARDRMSRAVDYKFTALNHRLQKAEDKLQTISPLRTLGRGYAIIRLPNGSVLQDAHAVRPGDQVEAWLHKGKVKLRVEECIEDWGTKED
jgi:exodeoxyribonuclease VII large subunit